MIELKGQKAIRERIKESESDERHKSKPALVEINAPLALIQVELDTTITQLKFAQEQSHSDLGAIQVALRKARRKTTSGDTWFDNSIDGVISAIHSALEHKGEGSE